MCSAVTEESDMHSMVRLNANASHCPFTGPRKFTFELPQGECGENLSEIISSKDTELKFQFASCESLLNGFDFGDKSKYSTLISWEVRSCSSFIFHLELFYFIS